jgi:hypothetical protein
MSGVLLPGAAQVGLSQSRGAARGPLCDPVWDAGPAMTAQVLTALHWVSDQ